MLLKDFFLWGKSVFELHSELRLNLTLLEVHLNMPRYLMPLVVEMSLCILVSGCKRKKVLS